LKITPKVSHFWSRRPVDQWTPQGEKVTGVCSSLAQPAARLNFHHSLMLASGMAIAQVWLKSRNDEMGRLLV
jgi:hypothetical protein